MQTILYSHRLKTVLQHSVVEMGLTVSMDDESANVSLSENEAVIRETAAMLRIKVNIEKSGTATTVVFYR